MEVITPLLLFHLSLSVLVGVHGSAKSCNFGFDSFRTSNDPRLKFSGDGKVSGGAAEISFDSLSSNSVKRSWGWVVNAQKLQFKPSRGRGDYSYTSASFNTSFHMNLQVSKNNTGVGGGVAFMLVPFPEEPNKDSERVGQWLGLYNQSIDGQRSNNIIAIEMDTHRDEFDPDGNHVGLDLNSIRSFRTQPLHVYSIDLSDSSHNITVWVDYDGHGKRLDVFIVNSGVNAASNKSQAKNVLSVIDIDLGNYTSDVVYAGFAASSGDELDLHCLLSWNFSMDCFRSTDNHLGMKIGLITGIVSATLIGIISVVLMRLRNRGRKAPDSRLTRMELDGQRSSGPRRFSYKELSKATGNFNRNNKLGSGASGTVYKAALQDKTVVAVKRISCKGVKEFVAEVSCISRLRHRNILPLIGWSFNRDYEDELLLVYQFMPNGSLDRWLFSPTTVEGHPCPAILDWGQRYKVLCGTAAALGYLHQGWDQTIIHRDVKASNIMLDSDFTPRLGDFGLARVIEHGLSQLETMHMAGTPGYIPPEMLDMRIVTKQVDVYSFGMVVLEVVCGKRPIYKEQEQSKFLLEWVWELYEDNKLVEAADSRLALGSYDKDDMERVLKVGLFCANPNMMHRPTMSQVLQELTTKGPCSFHLTSSKPTYHRPHLPISTIYSSSSSSWVLQEDQISQVIPQ